MRVAIYIRVSTDEQANEGFSIEAQKRRLVSYADSQDWTIADVFIDDGYSAKDLDRPAMKRMLEGVREKQFDVVLVYKLDRMTRSTADCDYLLKLFEAHEVKFQSSSESFETRTATGRLFIRLVADIAQWERENIGERVRFGMEQKALEGKRPGGLAPFGYTKEEKQIPEEIDLIREVRKLYIEGDTSGKQLGFKSIARLMNQQVKLRRGSEWSAATVQSTLENPYYAGIIQYGTKLPNGKYPARKRRERVKVIETVGSHEPVWSVEEYEEHMKLMKMRSGGSYSRKKEYWFTGVLRCGKCGSAMNGRLSLGRMRNDGSRMREPYYFCQRRHDGRSCDQPMFRQLHIEQLLMDYIEHIRLEHRVMLKEAGKLLSNTKKTEQQIKELQRELADVSERRKKWQYLFVQNPPLISIEDLRARTLEENDKEALIKEKLQELKQQTKPSGMVTEQLAELSEIWGDLSDQEKGELIRTIFKEIVLYTPLGKVKGVKNRFFEAEIQKVTYN